MAGILSTALTLRPAEASDLPQIAELLVQLYEAELPSILLGSREKQAELIYFTLSARNFQGLRHRYVLCDQDCKVIGTAGLELPNGPYYERAPDGTVAKAFQLLGVGPALRLFTAILRQMCTGPRPEPPQAVLLHSFVIDKARRINGYGRAGLAMIEEEVQRLGFDEIYLEVLAENTPARRLYQGAGYNDIWQSPLWTKPIRWPCFLMLKKV
jgi:ribosomal protein S18 acetylase RimI-like enzyme